MIREYADIKELDAATLNRLVKEILVHEEIDKNRKRHISVEIHFNFKSMTGGTDGGGNASTATRYQFELRTLAEPVFAVQRTKIS